MIIITERPSVQEIKMFTVNGDVSSFIANLKQNRGIPDEDLNVFEVTDGTKFICDAKNYSIEIEAGCIHIYSAQDLPVQRSKMCCWVELMEYQWSTYYSAEQVAHINYLKNRYSTGVIAQFYSGSVPFPSDYSIVDDVYVNIPYVAVGIESTSSVNVLTQVIEVEVLDV